MRKMKDSGVEWIGEIPEKWLVLRNKNAFSCDKIIVGEDSETTQLLSLTTKGIKKKDINNAEGKLPESFDTYQRVAVDNIVMCLFDLDCSAVFSGISPYEGMISPAYRVLMCKDNIVPQYANYWFRYISDGRKFNHYAKNIRYTLSYEEFSALPILMPDVNTQKRIVDFLNAKCAKIDAVITRQQEAVEKLIAYKQSVITETIGTYIAELPVKRLGDYISVLTDYHANGSYEALKKHVTLLDEPDYALMVRTTNLERNDFVDNVVYISKDAYEFLEKSKVYGDEVIINKIGSAGKVYYMPQLERPVSLAMNQFLLRFTSDCNAKFVFYYLHTKFAEEQIAQRVKGAVTLTITKEAVRSIPVSFPTLDQQNRIVQYLEEKSLRIDMVLKNLKKEITRLEEYKKSLIYEVVTGKREV